MKNNKILFIVEQEFLDDRLCFGVSNDLLLVFGAFNMGLQVYLTTPQRIAEENSNEGQLENFMALKLSENLDQKDIISKIKNTWKTQVTNCLLALPTNTAAPNFNNKILFLDAKIESVNLQKILIFNRAEPVSLTDKFYDILISWQQNGVKIIPNPYLNKILGDKLAIDSIHNNIPIAGIDLLEDVSFQDQKNKISFESTIVTISKNNLRGEEIIQFYELIIAQNFQKAREIFGDEYQIFMQGAKQYLAFHQTLNNDSIIKPANYFGGVGVVVAKNQTLDLNQAIANITRSFLAIKQDCQKKIGDNNYKNLAFLPTIIVQQRATEAYLGDLRIMLYGNHLQGIFVRINPNFEKSQVNNLRFGGHPESLFKHYKINKSGVDLMIDDMKKSGLNDKNIEIKKALALYGLLETLDFLKQIKILEQYPIIGIDALLTCDQNNGYRYGINEINLTSPMGQAQLFLLQIAIKFSELATKILQNNGFKIYLKKYQILTDFFKNQDDATILQAREILLQDRYLQCIIGKEVEKLLDDNTTIFKTKIANK